MLLFTRIGTSKGSPRAVTPWALEITRHAASITGVDVACWAGRFGYPAGTLAWTALVESHVAWDAATSRLMADDGYLDLLDTGGPFFTTPVEDRVGLIVHGSPAEPPPLGAVAQVTQATAVIDRISDALAWSVEIAEYIESVTSVPVAVLTQSFGQMGAVTWISVAPDMATAEAVGTKGAADAGYLERLKGSRGLFLPGSGHVAQSIRIA